MGRRKAWEAQEGPSRPADAIERHRPLDGRPPAERCTGGQRGPRAADWQLAQITMFGHWIGGHPACGKCRSEARVEPLLFSSEV